MHVMPSRVGGNVVLLWTGGALLGLLALSVVAGNVVKLDTSKIARESAVNDLRTFVEEELNPRCQGEGAGGVDRDVSYSFSSYIATIVAEGDTLEARTQKEETFTVTSTVCDSISICEPGDSVDGGCSNEGFLPSGDSVLDIYVDPTANAVSIKPRNGGGTR